MATKARLTFLRIFIELFTTTIAKKMREAENLLQPLKSQARLSHPSPQMPCHYIQLVTPDLRIDNNRKKNPYDTSENKYTEKDQIQKTEASDEASDPIADEWSHKGLRVDSASANHEEKILEKLTRAK
ncbi:hypothetical protein BOTCAL_0223g00100 [Botryotinia calthae]|uniref:Uncharacterized protein n=1 Tax=Botryotinia calthae TaxID=38488 RepID=A0A4Y8D097_9HELO|nr:hypothetical protein BOTCAL_0223g00100 [Botryotinia calthae]